MKKKNILYFLPWFILSITLLFGCSSTRDEALEKKLIDALILHKTDDTQLIDLRDIFGNAWRKICIPGPYQTKESFESMTGETVINYPGVPIDGYTLLILYEEGKISHVEISALKVMDWLSKGSACTSINNPYLYLEVDNDGFKKYFLNDKEH